MTGVAEDQPAIRIDSHLDQGAERGLADDVLDGLTRPFKELPPKYFYDSRGSELFERICELPEYYPTRAELEILRTHADAIVADAGEAAGEPGPAELVELGSGAATKARLLLTSMAEAGTLRSYVPVDVSERVVHEAAVELVDDYPGLSVHGVVGDFERHLDRIPRSNGHPRLVALLGGTVGNFPPGSRRRLLRQVARMLGPHDQLLMGTDLVKDSATLEAAYDDSEGVTAEFNRNILHVVNRELDADFDPDGFEHVAFFDRQREWVEMRLRSRRRCAVRVAALDLDVGFEAGEEMRTEISAKFTRERVEGDYAAAGLRLAGWYPDADDLFAVSLASA